MFHGLNGVENVERLPLNWLDDFSGGDLCNGHINRNVKILPGQEPAVQTRWCSGFKLCYLYNSHMILQQLLYVRITINGNQFVHVFEHCVSYLLNGACSKQMVIPSCATLWVMFSCALPCHTRMQTKAGWFLANLVGVVSRQIWDWNDWKSVKSWHAQNSHWHKSQTITKVRQLNMSIWSNHIPLQKRLMLFKSYLIRSWPLHPHRHAIRSLSGILETCPHNQQGYRTLLI